MADNEENMPTRRKLNEGIGTEAKTPSNLNGLLEVRSAEDAIEDRSTPEEVPQAVAVMGLAGHIRGVWSSCRDGRSTITEILNQCRRQRNGEYDPEIQSRINSQGTSDAYVNITNRKCESGESWIVDMISDTDYPWTIEPTPIPEVNDDTLDIIASGIAQKSAQLAQEGRPLSQKDQIEMGVDALNEFTEEINDVTSEATKRMTRIMQDQVHHGNWRAGFGDFVYDLVTYPAGIMKFEMKREVKTVFVEDKDEDGNAILDAEGNVSWVVATEPVLRETWRRVNPFNFYPSPNMKDVNDGDLCERIEFKRKDLTSLIGVEGYNDDEIRLVLEEYGRGGLSDWTDRDEVARLNYESALEKDSFSIRGSGSINIDAVEFHGSVQGSMLMEWGMTEIKDDLAEYDIWAILIGNHVITARLNPNPLGNKPYYVYSYERDPDSIWGKGIAQKVRQSQNGANQARRALMNNISLSSGPQIAVNQHYLSPSENISNIWPYKIWRMNSGKASKDIDVRSVFSFFQPASNADELLGITQIFANEADEDSAIPKVAEGAISNSMNNATSTASGLSMVLDQASKGMRSVISGVDRFIIERQMNDLYVLNMLDPNIPNSAKGDAQIKARGIMSTAIAQKLQALRQEMLMIILSNENLVGLLGTSGVASILREVIKPLKMDDELVPSKDALEAQERQAIEAQQSQSMAVEAVLNIAKSKGLVEDKDIQAIMEEFQKQTGGQE